MASTIDKNEKGITFGLIFFASSEAPHSGDKYRLVIESAKFADRHGFSSVWIPERHFTKDGWLYPNPAVLQAAIARETQQIQLRAGSVVLPLHNPIRVAEEWAMVDNLSGGRVGLSFASGWHPNDFALFPEHYEKRNEVMYKGIETVRKLWRGEAIQVKGGDGKMVEIRTYPTPIQRELQFWVTAAGNPKTFAGAGELGANLLTHMYNQSVDELAEKIRIYREARAKQGYDPETGQVSVMLHTFVGESLEAVRELAQEPFINYLKSASYLLNAIAYSRGQKVDLSTLSEQDFNDYLYFVFDRMMSTQRVLFGTPESCFELVKQLRAAGVNEVACQLDFGLDVDVALDSMVHLNRLKELCDSKLAATPSTSRVVSRNEEIGVENRANGSSPAREQIRDAHALQQGNRLEDVRRRCREEVDVRGFYARLSERGIELNAGFRGIERLWRRDGEALGQVRLPSAFEQESTAYQVHPTLLDACFQVLIATLPDALFKSDGALYLPTGMSSFQLHRQPGQQVWSHAVLKVQAEQDGAFEGDVRVLDERGEVLIEARGIHLQRSEPVGSSNGLVNRAPTPLHASTPLQHDELADWLYELRWEPKAAETWANPQGPTRDRPYNDPMEEARSSHRRGEPARAHKGLPSVLPKERVGKWLVFMDGAGVGYRLTELLAGQGATCFIVAPGESYQVLGQRHYSVNPERPEDMQRLVRSVLEADGEPLRGVVHLWSLDAASPERISANSRDEVGLPRSIGELLKDQAVGSGSALSVIQALVAIEGSELPKLWLITQGAQPVGGNSTLPRSIGELRGVAQAPIWGLGRTCSMEHPEIWGGLVDLDPQGTTDEVAEHLLGVVADTSGEDQTAFRQGERYVARMVRSRGWTGERLELRPDASYLITGGFWGLGFEVARWMVQKGARHLVLMGRTQVPPRSRWDNIASGTRQAQLIAGIRELEARSVQVHCATVDVTDEAQLAAFLREYRQQGNPPIKGVMHAASVWQDAQGQSLVRPLANLDETALKEVFRPKVIGSWLLHRLLQDTRLDFFVSFSSGASLFGSAAQGNYAAAGAFLDALAHYQRGQGQAAISIDWGAISEIGFGATAEGQRVHEYWEAHGIQRITPRDVLAALELLIPQNVAQVGVIKLDWKLLRQFYPQIATLPLVTHLIAETGGEQGGTEAVAREESAIVPALLAAEQGERQRMMEAYLCEQVAGVLRVPASRLDVEQPLTTLGLDSLMAIELKNRIELELKVRIPIVTFLQGPSIAQFAAQVLEQVTPVATVVSNGHSHDGQKDGSVAIMNQEHAEEILTRLDQLSDQEVDSLLNQMLQEENGQVKAVLAKAVKDMSPQEAGELLAQIDQLSDEHVDVLLSQIAQEEDLNR